MRIFRISEGFWEVLRGQNGGQNRFFGCFFAMFFWNVFLHRFLGGFLLVLEGPSLDFVRTASVLEHFHKIDVFVKSGEKSSISDAFWEGKPTKNHEKMVLRDAFIFNIDFLAFFFRISTILARFWEARGNPKIDEK